MTISLDKKYRTRDGREVRIYAVDGGTEDYPVHGATYTADDGWKLSEWTNAGHGCHIGGLEHWDLIEVKEKHVRYVNFYLVPNGGTVFTWPTRAGADAAAIHNNRTACIRIEFEEGQFDE